MQRKSLWLLKLLWMWWSEAITSTATSGVPTCKCNTALPSLPHSQKDFLIFSFFLRRKGAILCRITVLLLETNFRQLCEVCLPKLSTWSTYTFPFSNTVASKHHWLPLMVTGLSVDESGPWTGCNTLVVSSAISFTLLSCAAVIHKLAHAHATWAPCTWHHRPGHLNIRGFYFRCNGTICENPKSLHHAKISCYTIGRSG